MRFVVAPDSYKGSLSAVNVAGIMAQALEQVFPKAEIIKVPIADGGEGTVDALLTAVGGKKCPVKVTGPLGEKVDAFFGLFPDGKTAVIEMAAASGLTLVPIKMRNPLKTTSYGTGELIKMALEAGCEKIIVGLGGSATNDGGVGMAQALGMGFYNGHGQSLGFGGESLSSLSNIDILSLDSRIKNTKILAACDVDNPLCGLQGASAVFGPQKGATPEMIEQLDLGLARLAGKIKENVGIDVLDLPGAGAAGGLGGGLVGLLGAELQPGIDIVVESTGLDKIIEEADLVITGEGQTDFQTARGKGPVGVAQIAKKHRVPVIAISGGLGERYHEVYEAGIDAVFSIVPGPVKMEMAMSKGAEYLFEKVLNLARLLSVMGLK